MVLYILWVCFCCDFLVFRLFQEYLLLLVDLFFFFFLPALKSLSDNFTQCSNICVILVVFSVASLFPQEFEIFLFSLPSNFGLCFGDFEHYDMNLIVLLKCYREC